MSTWPERPAADLDSTGPMSAPDRTNGHGSPYDGPPRGGFDGPVAPPQNLEAEQSVLGAVLLSDTALPALIIDERLQPGRLLPREPRAHLPGDARPALGRRAGRRADARRAPQAGGRARRRRRPRGDRPAGRLRPGRRQRAPVRADRARERDAAPPAARLVRDPGAASTATRRSRATSSTWPSARSSRSPTRTRRKDFRSIERAAATPSSTSSQKLSLEGKAITGTAVRLRGPRHDHRRLPARQPDHPRRTPVDGQVAR